MKTYTFDQYTLSVGEPVPVLSGGTWQEFGWGPYQFPGLRNTRNGHILCTCTGPAAVDDIDGYEGQNDDAEVRLPFGRVSEDGGATWREVRAEDVPMGVVMANGREYFSPAPKNAFTAPWLDKYEPVFTSESWRKIEYFRADDIPEFPRTPEAEEYDPVTGQTERFRMEVEWPNLTVLVSHHPKGRLIFPMEMLMGGMGFTMPDPDGTLYFCTYGNGCSAETGKPMRMYTVTVLRSDDCGRHWKYLSEITTPQDWVVRNCEGYCEPCMTRMPDGSVIMLMRTSSGQPSYLTRSTDNCETWSEPEVFDKVGVLPKLLTLKCGVTLASYGRPGVFLRSTNDPSGLVWDKPADLEIPDEFLPGAPGSCCYTSLLPLDDTTALLAYSHFCWPNEDGAPVKTILVRKIRVEKK